MKLFAMSSILVASGLVFSACGAADREKGAPGELLSAGSSDGQDVITHVILSEGAEASGEDATAGAAASLALTGEQPNVTYTRECSASEDGNEAEARAEFTFSAQHEGQRITMSHEGHRLAVRSWTRAPEGELLACHLNKHVAIDLSKEANVVGLKLTATIDAERSMEGELRRRNGEVRSFSRSVSVNGTHAHEWLSVAKDEEAGKLVIERRTSINVTRKIVKDKEISTSVKTLDDAPLQVRITRDATTLERIEREILAGAVRVERSNGNVWEARFTNVRYLASAPCVPVAGTIAGSVAAADKPEEKSEFSLTFADNAVELKVNGEVVELENYEDLASGSAFCIAD